MPRSPCRALSESSTTAGEPVLVRVAAILSRCVPIFPRRGPPLCRALRPHSLIRLDRAGKPSSSRRAAVAARKFPRRARVWPFQDTPWPHNPAPERIRRQELASRFAVNRGSLMKKYSLRRLHRRRRRPHHRRGANLHRRVSGQNSRTKRSITRRFIPRGPVGAFVRAGRGNPIQMINPRAPQKYYGRAAGNGSRGRRLDRGQYAPVAARVV